MICAVYGTTGELIKLAPVLSRLQDRGLPFLQVTTAQQVEQLPRLLGAFRLPEPELWLRGGPGERDLERSRDIPVWLARVAARFARERRALRRRLAAGGGRPLVLVHGDTMTTVLGTLMGKALRVPVAHVEAGVRTFDLLHPFPEELSRRLVSRLADVHYAPGPAAAANLRRGVVVDTGANTIFDSLLLVPPDAAGIEVDEPFGLVSLHRFELLRNATVLRATLEALAAAARETPLLFVDHPVTVAALERFGLTGLFDDRLRRVRRLDFFGFVALLRRCAFVVTDSGGTQLEASSLDKPCLVHRKLVEQDEGVGENVVVSGLRVAELERFLADPFRHRRRNAADRVSPSDLVVEDLVQRGYAG